MQQSALLIPAYKPDDRLPPYVAALKEAGVGKIVIVDDGSGESFQPLFQQIPQDDVTVILSYTPNGGKGHALKTGMQYLLDHCPEQKYIITADSDGQHTVTDVLRMVEALHENDEGLLLGSRDFSRNNKNVPARSRFGNRTTTVVFKLFYGQWVEDTQTGLRGFERGLLPTMVKVRGERYEYEMNMLIDCAQMKIPLRSLPIETVYENNNEGSHFRPFQDSVRIYSVILGSFLKFIGTALISWLVDYGLFVLLNFLLKTFCPGLEVSYQLWLVTITLRIAIAKVVARLVSGVVNYSLNKKLVFEDKGSVGKSGPRYLVVFVLNLLASVILISTLCRLTGISENLLSIPVDIFLFIVNYFVQRAWVFPKKQAHPTETEA